MAYTLQNDGDDLEKRLWPELSSGFPNYELFWQEFIVPLTRRKIDGRKQLRANIDPLLEEMCMTHYSVFHHLGVAHELFDKMGLDYYGDIFFHLSAATEMVDRLLLTLAKIFGEIRDVKIVQPLDEQQYLQKIAGYLKGNYKQDFERFQSTGQTVGIPLHSIKDITRWVYSQMGEEAMRDYKRWLGLTDQIKHYRNALTHNPLLAQLLNPHPLLPRERQLKNYMLWSDVIYRPKLEDFALRADLVSHYQTELESTINKLWQHLIDLLKSLSVEDAYLKMTEVEGIAPIPAPPFPIDEPFNLKISSGSNIYDFSFEAAESNDDTLFNGTTP